MTKVGGVYGGVYIYIMNMWPINGRHKRWVPEHLYGASKGRFIMALPNKCCPVQCFLVVVDYLSGRTVYFMFYF